MGPVEYLLVEFPGNRFKGEIVPALVELVENNTIRIIDLLFVKKDANGEVTFFELSDLNQDESVHFDNLEGEINGLLSEEDIFIEAELLQNNSSAALLVFENVWATRLQHAILNADGRLVDNARIPASVVQAAMNAAGIPVE